MAVFERSQVDVLVERLSEPPARLIALFGPRQSGKSTIVLQALQRINKGRLYLSVDEPEPFLPLFHRIYTPGHRWL